MFVWTLLFWAVQGSAFAEPVGFYSSSKEQSVFEAVQNGRPVDAWDLMLASEQGLTDEEAAAWKSDLVVVLDRCRAKSVKPTVDLVFRTLRASFLRTYKEGVSTAIAFRSGQFNCLSGSALVGMGMEMMGWKVEFRVEPTHVYLLVQDEGKWYRVEATSEDFGAIRTNGRTNAERVAWQGLAGLQYYNSGLVALDAGNLEAAVMCFEKARMLNQDPRVLEMLDFCGIECRRRSEEAFEDKDWSGCSRWMALSSLCHELGAQAERIWVSSLLMEASSKPTISEAYRFLLHAADQSASLLDNLDFATSLAETGLAFSIDQMMDSWTEIGGLSVLAELEGSLALESLPVDPQLRSKAYGLAEHLSRAYEEADMMASNR